MHERVHPSPVRAAIDQRIRLRAALHRRARFSIAELGAQLTAVRAAHRELLTQPRVIRRAICHARRSVKTICRLHRGGERHAPFATGIRLAHDLIKARARLPSTLPVAEQVRVNALRRIAVVQPLTRLGQIQHAPRDDRLADAQHAGRHLTRRRQAERLTQHAVRCEQ